MNFWENVDEELKYLGKSRKELAQEADFDVSYISKGIARGGVPLADLAVRISHVLNVPVERLLGMEKAKQKPNVEINKNLRLLEKYSSIIKNLEKMPKETQEKFIGLAADFAKLKNY